MKMNRVGSMRGMLGVDIAGCSTMDGTEYGVTVSGVLYLVLYCSLGHFNLGCSLQLKGSVFQVAG